MVTVIMTDVKIIEYIHKNVKLIEKETVNMEIIVENYIFMEKRIVVKRKKSIKKVNFFF